MINSTTCSTTTPPPNQAFHLLCRSESFSIIFYNKEWYTFLFFVSTVLTWYCSLSISMFYPPPPWKHNTSFQVSTLHYLKMFMPFIRHMWHTCALSELVSTLSRSLLIRSTHSWQLTVLILIFISLISKPTLCSHFPAYIVIWLFHLGQ